jgi:preprotein translocase subunit SecY
MNSDLMRRIAFTLGALLAYRIGTFIPLPGIDPAVWEQIFRGQAGGLLGMFNLFSGGALSQMAIFALNLGPYLTAAIFVQMALLFSSRFRAVNDRGDRGRQIVRRWTLMLTLLFAAVQSYGIARGLEGFGQLGGLGQIVAEPGFFFRLSTVIALTGGTFLLIWLTEIITAQGVGNGLALIFLVNIVVAIPRSIAEVLELGRRGVLSRGLIGALAVLTIALIAFIVMMELARRHLPIEYERRKIGDRIIERQPSTLALKLNGAGMIPVVVAPWLLSILVAIAYIGDGAGWLSSITKQLGHGQPGYILYTVIAIVVFGLLYVALLIDPDAVAEKLKRWGGVIPGIDPGAATADHIDRVLSRTTILGAAYLALVSLVPEILISYAGIPIYLGGVPALIVVCTVLDIRHQVQAREYINREERHQWD